jgi:predicted PurR-regulated permease PerM
MAAQSFDLTRITLAVLFIGGLIAASFWIVQPFLPALVWATALVVAGWPLMREIQRRLWNRRALAVAVMTAVLLLVLIVPLALAITTIVDNADKIAGWVTLLATMRLPPPPDAVRNLPLVGEKIAATWEQTVAAGAGDLAARLAPYAGKVVGWFVSQVGNLGLITLQFLLTVIIAAVLYANGKRPRGHPLRSGGGRPGEANSAWLPRRSAASRRASVTALVQAPGSVRPCGPFAAIFTATLSRPARPIRALPADLAGLQGSVLGTCPPGGRGGQPRQFPAPAPIRRVRTWPLLLIIAGVIGGLIAFGFVGIFIGPVVLAVAHTLLEAWTSEA